MGHLPGHAPPNSAPIGTPPGGSGLIYLNQGGRIFKRSLLLEPQHPNGTLAKAKCRHLYFGGKILRPSNYVATPL